MLACWSKTHNNRRLIDVEIVLKVLKVNDEQTSHMTKGFLCQPPLEALSFEMLHFSYSYNVLLEEMLLFNGLSLHREEKQSSLNELLSMECYASSLGRFWEGRLKPAGQMPLVLLKLCQDCLVHDVSHRTLNFNCFSVHSRHRFPLFQLFYISNVFSRTAANNFQHPSNSCYRW